MVSTVPAETVSAAFELLCYFFTVMGAVVSFMFTLRG